MSRLGQRLLAIDDALTRAGLAHAFGGAIALAYCTEEPRGTRDLDVNVFVGPDRAEQVFAALASLFDVDPADVRAAAREGQVRVWWDDTPVDVFLDVHRFHADVARGVRSVPFEGRQIDVLDCTALATFKALFDRTKDWADIEEMAAAGTLDAKRAVSWTARLAGAESPLVARLASVGGVAHGTSGRAAAPARGRAAGNPRASDRTSRKAAPRRGPAKRR